MRLFISRVQKQPDVMRDLEPSRDTQAAVAGIGRRARSPSNRHRYVRRASRRVTPASQGAFPKNACFVATDFAKGGAVDRRELFLPDRMRQGIAACLDALDTAGARSLVLPLLGAASSTTQRNDAQYEGQRILKECRLLNSTTGIASAFTTSPPAAAICARSASCSGTGSSRACSAWMPAAARNEPRRRPYRAYAKQVSDVFRKGLAGQKSRRAISGELHGNSQRQVATNCPEMRGACMALSRMPSSEVPCDQLFSECSCCWRAGPLPRRTRKPTRRMAPLSSHAPAPAATNLASPRCPRLMSCAR